MPSQLAYPELLQPLSPGNTVSAGIRLYRSHFKEYSGIAIHTVSWIAGLLILGVAIGAVFYAVLPPGPASLLLVPLVLVLSFYCFGRYLAGAAAISRLVFKTLMGEFETAKAARSFTNPKSWGFGLIGLILFVLFSALIILLYVALAIVAAFVIGALGGFSALENTPWTAVENVVRNPAVAIALLLGILGLLLFFTLVWTWVAARFALAELPYGIEAEVKASDSVGRSWVLTEKNVWHTVMVLFVTSLVMIPLNIAIQIASSTVQLVLVGLAGSDNVVLLAIFYLVSIALALFGLVVTLPLSQAIKGVMYYDLRNRREGLNLLLHPEEPVDGMPLASPTDVPIGKVPPVELFRKVTLQTPESVELEFTLAGIGNRGLALLIDSLLVMLAIAFFWFFGSLLATQIVSQVPPDAAAVVILWLVAIALLGTFLISAGYFVLFETLRQGQTPGKRFAQIRVIRDDGRPVGLTQSVLRALLRPIDDIFWTVGSVLILFDQNEKRLGDLVAGTLVIQEERANIKRKIALSDRAQSLAEELASTSDVKQLHPDDFAVVREFLQRRDQMTAQARTDTSLNLARQVRTAIHLENIPEGINSDQFLEALYLAYQGT